MIMYWDLVKKKFELLQIACLLTKNNVTHDAEYNAITLLEEYLHRFGIELYTDVKYMTSDTASAARVVSKYVEDIEQVDCEMHVLKFDMIVWNWTERKREDCI
jgi:hypothetical protein